MWRVAGLALVLAGACRAPSVVAPSIDAEEGDVIVAVVVGPDGSIQTMDVVDELSQPLGLPASEGAELFTFVVASGDLIGVDGSPADTSGLIVIPSAETAGHGCGVCQSPASRAPQVVQSGDVCPIPSFANVQRWSVAAGEVVAAAANAADTTAVVETVRIVWPGACPCEAESVGSGVAPTLTLLTGDDGRPADASAVSLEGSVGVFGERFATVVDENGTRTSIDTVPWKGMVTSAVGLSGRRFVVATTGRTNDVHLVQPNREVVELRGDDALASFRLIRPTDTDAIVIAGRRTQQPALHTCAIEDDRLDCGPMALDVAFGTRFSDLAVLDGGLVVAVTNAGAPTFFERFVPFSEYRGHAQDRLTTSMGDVRLASAPPIGTERLLDVHAVGGTGRRVFVCAGVEGATVVLTASVPIDVFDDASKVAWQESYRSPSLGPCTDLRAGPAGSVEAFFTGGVVEFDGLGGVVDMVADEPTGRPLRARRSASTGSILYEGTDGSVFVRRSGQGVERVHGSPVYRPGWAGAIAAKDETHWIFGALGARFDGVDGVRVFEGLAADRIPVSAAYDAERDVFFVGGRCRLECEPWMLKVKPDGSSTPVVVPTDLGALLQIATLSSRVVVTFGSGIVVIRGDSVTPVNIDWGPRGRPTACGPNVLLAVSAADGIAWVTGCDGLVLRVVPSADRPHAERVEVLAEDDRPALRVVAARCADDVVVAARGSGFTTAEEEGFVWRFTSQSSAAYAPNAGSAVSGRASNDPIALVGTDRLFDIVFSGAERGAVHRFGTDQRLFFSAPFFSAAVTPSGRLLVGASNERLLAFE